MNTMHLNKDVYYTCFYLIHGEVGNTCPDIIRRKIIFLPLLDFNDYLCKVVIYYDSREDKLWSWNGDAKSSLCTQTLN